MGKRYAFSDIHGDYNLFKQIKEFLKDDDVCYVLGDCIDRGESGYRIMNEVIKDDRFIYIRGNHEEMLAAAYGRHDSSEFWLWINNGGQPTYNAMLKDDCDPETVKVVSKLPLIDTYTNVDGITFIMSHAGFSYDIEEKSRDYLWDRYHFYFHDDIPDDVIVIHGHTPCKYLRMDSKLISDLVVVSGESCNGTDGIVKYNGGRKIDIDCGTYETGFIVLYCLDDYKIYGFYNKGA